MVHEDLIQEIPFITILSTYYTSKRVSKVSIFIKMYPTVQCKDTGKK
jgi:hypothetical protein